MIIIKANILGSNVDDGVQVIKCNLEPQERRGIQKQLWRCAWRAQVRLWQQRTRKPLGGTGLSV